MQLSATQVLQLRKLRNLRFCALNCGMPSTDDSNDIKFSNSSLNLTAKLNLFTLLFQVMPECCTVGRMLIV